MAVHNKVRLVGYLKKDPVILNNGDEGNEKILFTIHTTRRNLDYYNGPKFQDIVILYDDTRLMPVLKKLIAFDLVDITGVFMSLITKKKSKCPNEECGMINEKEFGVSSFVYPIDIVKLNSLHTSFEHSKEIPERVLLRFEEVSNQAMLIGRLITDPQIFELKSSYVADTKCCRYKLHIDRKYFVKTQSDITYDSPWIYTYGKQAEDDARYLRKGAVIFTEAFIQCRRGPSTMVCKYCGTKYTYPDVETEFVPYSIEYMSGFLNEAEASALESSNESIEAITAASDIFNSF